MGKYDDAETVRRLVGIGLTELEAKRWLIDQDAGFGPDVFSEDDNDRQRRTIMTDRMMAAIPDEVAIDRLQSTGLTEAEARRWLQNQDELFLPDLVID
ncbi:hypothetical protein GC207_11340 [bacterium]|nr:hypothetical protein [bacterium]